MPPTGNGILLTSLPTDIRAPELREGEVTVFQDGAADGPTARTCSSTSVEGPSTSTPPQLAEAVRLNPVITPRESFGTSAFPTGNINPFATASPSKRSSAAHPLSRTVLGPSAANGTTDISDSPALEFLVDPDAPSERSSSQPSLAPPVFARHWDDGPATPGRPSNASSATHDIVIPSRLFSIVGPHGRRSTDISSRRSDPSSRKDSHVHFDVQEIAYHQSQAARAALARSADISAGRGEGSRGSLGYSTGRLAPDSPRRGRKMSLRPSWAEKPEGDLGKAGVDEVVKPKPAFTADPAPTVFWANPNPFGSSAHQGSDSSSGSGDSHGMDLAKDATDGINPTILKPWTRQSTLRIEPAARPSHVGPTVSGRRGTISRAGSMMQSAAQGVGNMARRMSMVDLYERAKVRGAALQRERWAQIVFEWTFHLLLVAFVYFVLVGMPLWKGAVYWLYIVVKHKFVVAGTWAVTVGIAAIYAFAPLFILFEKDPPPADDNVEIGGVKGVADTALLIPCYKSANIIGPTLDAALKIFPASHIFVLANGNSPTPLDNTEEVCERYGVNHIWSPVGSKIVAQFVGCFAARQFTNVLLIDDDCALPPNFPIVSDRLKGRVKCIGYTIKSVGPQSSKGTLCQQSQDLEYKLSGLQRGFAGMIGSATFPHGAISIWNTEFLISTFYHHPGYSVSEDWFFGHAARQLGSRITMCTSVFVETETPDAVFFSSGGSRGGFGEMTVFKQRFTRWNFFFVNGMFYNMDYVIRSWKLGWWEFGAKLFVLQEVYETLLYLTAPFMLPISLAVRPAFTAILFGGVFGLYLVNTIIFNEIHLRLKNERIAWTTAYLYYQFYKIILLFVNVASCYWSLYKYATYFAKRYPKIIEDEKAIDVVLRLEEQNPSAGSPPLKGRRMTVAAIGSQTRDFTIDRHRNSSTNERKMTLVTFGPRLSHGVSSGTRDRRVTAAVLFGDEHHDPLHPAPTGGEPHAHAINRKTSSISQSFKPERIGGSMPQLAKSPEVDLPKSRLRSVQIQSPTLH